MPLTCPVCRAANDVGPACRRCRADLTLCFAVESQRAAALAGARAAAAAGERDEALRLAQSATACRGGSDARRLVAALYLLAGNFPAALAAYQAAIEA